MVSRLDRKLLRDMRRLWPQLLAAVLVLSAGLSTLVMAGGLIRSLESARDGFYANQRLADIAASCDRGFAGGEVCRAEGRGLGRLDLTGAVRGVFRAGGLLARSRPPRGE
jgi:hypothetical protein